MNGSQNKLTPDQKLECLSLALKTTQHHDCLGTLKTDSDKVLEAANKYADFIAADTELKVYSTYCGPLPNQEAL